MPAETPPPLGAFLALGGNPRRELGGRWQFFCSELAVTLDEAARMTGTELARRVWAERYGVRALCGEAGPEDVWPPGTLEQPEWRLTEMATADAWTADALEDRALLEALEPWLDRPLGPPARHARAHRRRRIEPKGADHG